jgi:glutathione peroxidase-family protein
MERLIKFGLMICAFVLLSNINPPKKIYGIQFKDIDGKQTSLLSYRGKKTLVLIISGLQKDTALLNRLVPFYQRYKDSIGFVIIPSIEDGYSESNKAVMKKLFFESGLLQVLITEGCYTRKSAGSNQAELMQWFTNKAHNMREDRDIIGAGHRFFLNEVGGLQFSVFPGIPYDRPFIQNFMSWPLIRIPDVPGKDSTKKQN